jgi:D-tyrosyl-tRNA(Tyr) deacylase
VKAIVQRVERCEVRVDGAAVGRIGPGMLVLLGVMRGDDERVAQAFAERIAQFRFFADQAGKMNLSALELGRAALVVSQFTLAADGRKGRRPSFDRAAPPAEAEALYECFVSELRALGLVVETGRFRARMQVELVNDGPVSFALDSDAPAPGPPSAPV